MEQDEEDFYNISRGCNYRRNQYFATKKIRKSTFAKAYDEYGKRFFKEEYKSKIKKRKISFESNL